MTDQQWLDRTEMDMQEFDPRLRYYRRDVREQWRDIERRERVVAMRTVGVGLLAVALGAVALAGMWWLLFRW